MSYFTAINSQLLSISGLGSTQNNSFIESITEINVSLTLSGSSEVSVTVVDPDFVFATNNYFQIRRDVSYRGMQFEISAIGTSRSDAIHPQHTIQCRSKQVQLMKRDKRPEVYNGTSGYDLAQRMAARYGMGFVGERTTKKQAIVKIQNSSTDESVWSVLNSLASEQQFVFFESENTLFFCSEKFLLGKWGDSNFAYGNFRVVPFVWPEPSAGAFPTAKDRYILMDIPTIRRSDDDISAASGSMLVDRVNGANLRPGMTVHIAGIPSFEGPYIVTDVSFNEGEPDPIQVQFRTPVEPRPETTTSGGASAGAGGGSGAAAPTLYNSIMQNYANELKKNNVTQPFPVNVITPPQYTLSTSQRADIRYYTAMWLARIAFNNDSQARQIMYITEQAVARTRGGQSTTQVRDYIGGTQAAPSIKQLIVTIWNAYISNKSVLTSPRLQGLSDSAIAARRQQILAL